MTAVPEPSIQLPSDRPAPSGPAPDRPAPRADRFLLVGFGLLALAVPLLYALYTAHAWEDYFITFRHSANLVHGKGLLYNPPHRVHGFTSPLNTLLPALFYWMTGAGDAWQPALWMFRITSALAYAGGGLLIASALLRQGYRLAAIVFAALYLIETKAVVFTANGQETGLMLLFVGWTFACIVRGGPLPWVQLGLAWAGLQWTRPDGCIYVAASGVAALALARGPRRAAFYALLKAAAVCTVLYLPWFVFAWSYYGSPVPHTIKAKAVFFNRFSNVHGPMDVITDFFSGLWYILATTFEPIYPGGADWPRLIPAVGRAIGLFACLYWLLPTGDRAGRAASGLFVLLCVYFACVPIYPWYLPPLAVLGLLTLACATASAWRARLPALAGVLCVFVAVVIAQEVYILAGTCRQMKIQQAEIETGTRLPIGLWLRDHVQPGDRIYLEPLGYIGYFSNAYMMDFPGLVAPEVVAAARKGTRIQDLVNVLKPEWIVARPWEVKAMMEKPEVAEHYTIEQTFDARERLDGHGPFRGSVYAYYDSVFHVLRRKR